MLENSAQILSRFHTNYIKGKDSSLRLPYRDLLAKFGHPEHRLPPVFHVAGTNGKGSTCAFLRAMLEAAGYRVHVYTSPHLVTFHERIRIAGTLISEAELVDILSECQKLAATGSISYFEAATATAFIAFSRHAADFTIVETGLGGRLDATNVIEKPLATLITRLSYDHCDYLGRTIDKIAQEKAGIMRPDTPCFVAPQPETLALQTLRTAATNIRAPLSIGGVDWRVEEQKNGFRFTEATHGLDLPPPGLLGQHQYENAGLAIASLAALPQILPLSAIKEGLAKVEWPGRLQRLTKDKLAPFAPPETEIWIDGGHNDSAGAALATQISRWRTEDGAQPKPLHIILGMLKTKQPSEFLAPFAKNIVQLRTIALTNEPLSFTATALADEVKKLGIVTATSSENIEAAIDDLTNSEKTHTPSRILICGSLYLAGIVLKLFGE